MREVIKAMKALSDDTRLRILNIVAERDCCVCEVMQALNISQTRASRNLRILEEAGFLNSRREGLWMHYSLRTDKENFSLPLVKIVTDFARKNAIYRQDQKRLKKVESNQCGEIHS